MTTFKLKMAMSGSPIYDRSQVNSVKTRVAIEAAIDRLIEILDELDGDCDREEDDPPEPSLGWSNTMALGNTEDLEEERT